MVRTTKGRQKVAMAKMTSESNLQVTFSKRRAGLFKKASELCTLCGAEIAIIVFSPGKKAFSFGHPSVESVVDRFLNRMPAPLPARPPAAATDSAAGTMRLIEAHRNASVRELNVQLAQLEAQLEAEKKRGEALGQMRQAGPGVGLGQRWWEAPVGELGLPQLEQLKGALEELKGNAAKQVDQLLIEAANPTAAAVAPPFFGGNSGGVGPAYESKSAVFGSGGPMNGMMPPPPQAYNFGYGHGYF